MATTTITFGCYKYDRINALINGRVQIGGFALAPVILPASELFPRALLRNEFEVVELSASTYMMQVARKQSKYIAIPVPIARAFRHGAIYIRTDRNISTPKDLEGKIVGIPSYQFTAVMWMRGILQDQYGVDFRRMRYRTGAANKNEQVRRPEFQLPINIEISPLEKKSLSAALEEGLVDAVISPEPPDCYHRSNEVVRLFEDPAAVELAYRLSTGFFPTMHFIAIRQDVVDKNPTLPKVLFEALTRSKNLAIADLETIANDSANILTMPWFAAQIASTQKNLGRNFWPYGFAENRSEFEAMCRYSYEQYLCADKLAPEQLFHETTLALVDE